MSKIQEQLQSLSPSAFVEFIELDMTPKEVGSANKYYFRAETNELNANVVWQGIEYLAWPLEISGFDKQAGGALPRVRVKLANKSGLLTTLMLNFNGLMGSKLTRRRTFAKFLDAVNFTGGVNADADPTVELEADIFYFERVVNRNRLMVELEFASEFDVEGVMLPRRQITTNCRWVYRGAECAYAGKPIANEFGALLSAVPNDLSAPFNAWSNTTAYIIGDVVTYLDSTRVFTCLVAHTGFKPTTPVYWFEDKCGGRLSDCKLRPRTANVYPFGGFPGAASVPFSG